MIREYIILIALSLHTENNNKFNYRNEGCNDSASFCGLRDKLYPDKRSMGFPFDRPSAPAIATLQDFVAQGSNMARNQIQIRFTNTLVNRN